jgi:hypothetical protein
MNASAATANRTPSQTVLARCASTYRKVRLQGNSLRLAGSDAHFPVSRRCPMNIPGHDDIGPHNDVIVTSNQACSTLYRVHGDNLGINPITRRCKHAGKKNRGHRHGARSIRQPIRHGNLAETIYCDHSHPAIQELSDQFTQSSTGPAFLVSKVFLFVRDSIAFGGDHWQVKASETLAKGYGACFNKNLLMIAILRAAKVPSKLMANPLRKTFAELSVGSACRFFSDPFYHCFTKVLIDGQWKSIDPTLDRRTYDAFFKPAGVSWKIDWDGANDMLLYSESVAGPPREFNDIDEALKNNLDSHYLFKHEPRFICNAWLRMGNKTMWRKARRFSRPDRPGCDGKTR